MSGNGFFILRENYLREIDQNFVYYSRDQWTTIPMRFAVASCSMSARERTFVRL